MVVPRYFYGHSSVLSMLESRMLYLLSVYFRPSREYGSHQIYTNTPISCVTSIPQSFFFVKIPQVFLPFTETSSYLFGHGRPYSLMYHFLCRRLRRLYGECRGGTAARDKRCHDRYYRCCFFHLAQLATCDLVPCARLIDGYSGRDHTADDRHERNTHQSEIGDLFGRETTDRAYRSRKIRPLFDNLSGFFGLLMTHALRTTRYRILETMLHRGLGYLHSSSHKSRIIEIYRVQDTTH